MNGKSVWPEPPLITGYTGDPPLGLRIRGILLGCKPDKEVCIEIVFSVIQRKVIKPADFADLAALPHRLERFDDRYNRTARPFDRRFTSSDLAAMLKRLDTTGPEPRPFSPPDDQGTPKWRR